MADANGLLLAMMEPPSAMEDEFNDWYDTEHLPERNAIPGFLAGYRWVCLHGYPRWVATYFLTDAAVLQSPAYAKVGGNNASPWTKRVTARTIGRRRVVGERVGQAPAGPLRNASRLLVAGYEAPSATQLSAVIRDLEQAAGAMQDRPDIRLYHEVETSADAIWLLAGFAGPVGADAAMASFGRGGGIGASVFNLYMPYWKTIG